MCYVPNLVATEEPDSTMAADADADASILVATPGTDDKKVNVYQFPEEKLTHVVPIISLADTGKCLSALPWTLPTATS
jgi:hypothetical protein